MQSSEIASVEPGSGPGRPTTSCASSHHFLRVELVAELSSSRATAAVPSRAPGPRAARSGASSGCRRGRDTAEEEDDPERLAGSPRSRTSAWCPRRGARAARDEDAAPAVHRSDRPRSLRGSRGCRRAGGGRGDADFAGSAEALAARRGRLHSSRIMWMSSGSSAKSASFGWSVGSNPRLR
jgi:hypothetical protein